MTVQIQGSNNPLEFTRERTVTVTAPHPPKPVVTSYTGELQPDGSLLLKWTTRGTKVALPNLTSDLFLANGRFPAPEAPPLKLTLPLLNNDLYALTAMNDQGESDTRVFTTVQKYGIVRPAIDVGSQPGGIAVSPDSSHVFVAYIDNNVPSVIEVNLNNNPPFQVLPTQVRTGSWPAAVAVLPDGKYVFVVNSGDNSVTVFGGTPPFQLVAASVSAGNGANCLAVSGSYVFVPDNASGTFSVIDTANAPPFNVKPGPTLGQPTEITAMAVSPDGRYVFASDLGAGLWVVPAEAGDPPFRVPSPSPDIWRAHGVAVSPDGYYVFVANGANSTVSVIEASGGPKPEFQVLSPLDAGRSPSVLTVSPDGRFLFVGQDESDAVEVCVIDKNSHPPVQPFQTLSVGKFPIAIAASPNGQFIFVAKGGSRDDTNISVIEPVAVSM